MELYLTGILAFGIWSVVALRSADAALAGAIVALPFGMLAIARLPIGGMTPLASHVIAAFGVGLMLLGQVMPSQRRHVILPVAAIPALLLMLYAIFTTAVLLPLFEGRFMVFTQLRDAAGVRVSNSFSASLLPLEVRPTNASQLAYFLLSILFFLGLSDLVRRRGPDLLLKAIRVAASLNLMLCAINLAGLKSVLSLVQTANYALHDTHMVAGMPRLIGGFSEAAAFSSFSIVLGSFLLVLGVLGKSRIDLVLGILTLAVAQLALSSTAILGFGTLVTVLSVMSFVHLWGRLDREMVMWITLSVLVTTLVFALALLIPPVAQAVGAVLDSLLFSKSGSYSGLERRTLAEHGIDVAINSYGLGAGVGSARINGLFASILGSLGIPGALLFGWFLKSVFVDGAGLTPPVRRPLRRAAQVAVLVQLVMMNASTMSTNPGLLMMTIAALCAGSRMPLQGNR